MTRQEQPAPSTVEGAYREYRHALTRLAYLLCGSAETSEDVVQSVFASVHDRWDQVDDPLPYLKRAVVNKVKDGQRRLFGLRAAPQEPLSVTLPPEFDDTWNELSKLPSVQRAVVVLHYYEDLPLVQVANVLGRSPATVRSDHRRAIDKLRKALS